MSNSVELMESTSYYSNHVDGIAEAEVVTHPKRYLAIATSGGLNQQRTGVSFEIISHRVILVKLLVVFAIDFFGKTRIFLLSVV